MINIDINKHKFKKDVTHAFNSNPNLAHFQSRLTQELFKKSFIFIRGYMRCFEILAEEPINEIEIYNQLVSEVIQFIVDEINGEGQ